MAAPTKKQGVLDPIIALLRWIWNELERTIIPAIKLVFPSRFISPLGFLGMLTVVVFVILGVTGALLLFHYTPIFGDCSNVTSTPAACNQAFQSVQSINNQVNWGSIIRNIHYQASNAMVLLAVMHMFYQYFAGRYKLRYEILWVTGIILGVVTIIEAYTGYDLIFNIRGQLAIMSVHLPRNLVLDIPVASAITGIILILGGLFPVEVGVAYIPSLPTQITFPEWYFTSLYAFIRVKGLDPFIAGAIIPTIFVLIFLLVPFFDRGRKIAMVDRPFWVALGVAALGQIAIVTVWGFRASNPFLALLNENQLVVDPILFGGSLLIASALAYGFVYAFVRWRRAKLEALRTAKKPVRYRRVPPYILSKSEVFSLFIGLLILQGFLDFSIFRSLIDSLQNFALLEIGMVFVAFAATVHIYRVANKIK